MVNVVGAERNDLGDEGKVTVLGEGRSIVPGGEDALAVSLGEDVLPPTREICCVIFLKIARKYSP